MWEPVLRRITGRRIVMFDMPGTGGSAALRWAVRMRGYAALVVRLLDELGIGRTDVLGYSWGGALAQELVHRAPDRVGGVVLAATTPGLGGQPPAPWVIALMATPLRYYSRTYLRLVAPLVFGSAPDKAADSTHGDARLRKPAEPARVQPAAVRHLGLVQPLVAAQPRRARPGSCRHPRPAGPGPQRPHPRPGHPGRAAAVRGRRSSVPARAARRGLPRRRRVPRRARRRTGWGVTRPVGPHGRLRDSGLGGRAARRLDERAQLLAQVTRPSRRRPERARAVPYVGSDAVIDVSTGGRPAPAARSLPRWKALSSQTRERGPHQRVDCWRGVRQRLARTRCRSAAERWEIAAIGTSASNACGT